MDSSSVSTTKIYLLGPLQIFIGGEDIALSPRKTRALLAYLILRRGTPVPRETLLGIFWSERAEEQARTSLRQCLSLIKKAIGPDYSDLIEISRESVTIFSGEIFVDVEHLEQQLKDPSIDGLAKAVELYRGELLEGLSINEHAFQGWLTAERERYKSLIMGALKKLADLYEQNKQIDRAIVQTTTLLSLEPFQEATHRSLMHLHIAQGHHDAALRQFEQCKAMLRRELDVDPDPETHALWQLARENRSKSKNAYQKSSVQNNSATHRILFAISCAQPTDALGANEFEKQILDRSGQIVSSKHEQLLATFSNPSSAILGAMEIRENISRSEFEPQFELSIGLHAAGYPLTPSGIDPRDQALVTRIAHHADRIHIDVSEQFFKLARRESPCHFNELGEDSPQSKLSGVRIYRVTTPIARHPFLASHAVQNPRPEKRTNSIAVAPIKVAGTGNDDQDYLSEGLTEDLILELSRIKRLSVSSRTTVIAIGSYDTIEIGETLGVKYVLSGSIRMIGDTVRLSVSLAETERGEVVWSDRLQHKFDNYFDLFDTVVAKVAATVSGQVEQAEMSAARLKRPENMNAYEYFLRGVWHHRMGGVTSEHSRQAADWFRKSIEADPGFARPRAMLVCAWSDLPDFDRDLGEQTVVEGLKLDPTDPEVHRILGWARFAQGNYDAGKQHYERAVALAPNDAYILGKGAALHSFDGQPEKALELLDRAEVLDPFLPVYVVEERVVANYCLKEFNQTLLEAKLLTFQTRRTSYYTAAALVALDRLAEAKQVIADALINDPSLSSKYVRGQEIYRDRDHLKLLLKRLTSAGMPSSPANLQA